MNDIITVFKEFEGIIGALLGVTVTTVLNEWYKRKGKIIGYANNLKVEFIENTISGSVDSHFEEAIERTYEFDLNIYNDSKQIKFLKNIKVNIYSMYSDIKSNPQNRDDKDKDGKCLEIKSIYLMPRQTKTIRIIGTFVSPIYGDGNNSDIKKVVLTAIDNRNKLFKKIVNKY